MLEDAELLRRYAVDRSQAAFAELVRRRVDLVYSVALRQVGGDAHLAEDVTQKVFADLARKAATLLDRPVLSGWLYRSAQYAASDVVRSERRRRVREQESSLMQDLTTTGEPVTDWDRLRPLLDDALGELNDPDRDAIALRYFEGRAFAEIGGALRLTEEAARKRVDRALDKLAGILSRRGVTSTSLAIGTVLAQQAVAAPAGLAASVTGAALSGTAVTGGVLSGAGVLAWLASAKATIGLGIITAAAVGVAAYQRNETRRLENQLMAATAQHAGAQARRVETERRWQAAEKRAAEAEADNAMLLAAIASARPGRTAAVVSSAGPAPNPASETPDDNGPITRELVDARYKRGQELARAGQKEEALKEFLWCLDRGMPEIASYFGVRTSFLLGDIERLGAPGLAAITERRDATERKIRAGAADFQLAMDFVAYNRTLKAEAKSLALLDSLPAVDSRRRTLAMPMYDLLIGAQRYHEAVEVRPFARMIQQFESNARERPLPENVRDPAAMRRTQRDMVVRFTAGNVEVLAGAGETANARALAARLLAYDGSTQTRATLQDRATRAGQPRLLDGLPSP